MLPTTGAFNRRATPNTGRAVEIEKPSGEMSPTVFDDEVPIENDGLHLREKRIFTIDVAPPNLNHAHLRITEVIDDVLEEIRRRNEIGIEDRNEFAGCCLQAV